MHLLRSSRRVVTLLAITTILGSVLGAAALAREAVAQPAPVPVTTAKYTLFIYETPDQFALRGDTSPKGQAYWASFAEYGKALQQANILRGGHPLQPQSNARVVSLRNAQRVVTPGPLSATPDRQVLGGYFIIEVASLEEALDWAAKAPCTATGAVEVRPVLNVPGM